MKPIITFILTIFATTLFAGTTTIDGITYEIANAPHCRVVGCDQAKTTAIIPDTVKIEGKDYILSRIDLNAFLDCSSLTSISIPASVAIIEDEAFSGCGSLITIEVSAENNRYSSENGVLFNKDKTTLLICPAGKTSCSIPASVDSICSDMGRLAFIDCNSLISIEVADENPNYSSQDGALLNKAQTELIICPGGKTAYSIPASVTSILAYAFFDSNNLMTIDAAADNPNYSSENGVLFNKDKSKLEFCTSTKMAFSIAATVTSVSRYAFIGCNGLMTIEVAADNPNYSSQNGALFNKNKTTLIACPAGKTAYSIPIGVTKIDRYAFYYCKNLVSVEIPDSITSLDSYVFAGCSGLVSVEIPDSVTEIGSGAFSGCKSLVSIDIPDGVKEIERTTFQNCCSLVEVNIPSSVRSIIEFAFTDCSSLVSIEIPDSVTKIEWYAFIDCRSLISIDIPDRITSINFATFRNCSSLTNVNIPDSVISINSSAFSCCRNLSSIDIPDSVTSIDSSAFHYCANLSAINISDDNSVYSSYDGALFNKDQTKLLICPGGKVSCSIPDSVTDIGDYAFFDCERLPNVEIPSSVTQIGKYAFYYCLELTEIEIPAITTAIGDSVFESCENLSAIEFMGDAPSVDFSSMSGLTNLTIYYNEGATGFTSPIWQGYPCKMIYDLIPTKNYKGKINLKKGSLAITIWSLLPENLMGQTGTLEVTLDYKPLMSFEGSVWKWNSKKTNGKTTNEIKEKAKMKFKYEKSCLKLTSKYALTEKFNQIISQGEGTLRLTFADTDEALAIPIKWDQKGKLIPSEI